MGLPGPLEITIDDLTGAMLQDLDELAHQVNEIRPLDPEVLRQVKADLFGKRVYNSNAIEGSTLTLGETRVILETRSLGDARDQREAREALNLGEAAKRIEQLLEVEGAWHDVSAFLDVHEILMSGVNDRIAGLIRNQDVMIRGARKQPPGSREASELIDRFILLLDQSRPAIHGLILATWAHWAIARIHPFEDGNGRMARLWQDLLLLRARLTVAMIRPQDREHYLDALVRADEGDFNPLTRLICQRVEQTFRVYSNAQESADLLKGWASGIVGESNELDYNRWRHAVEQIRDAFERCASAINGESSLEVRIENRDIIDRPTWESLASAGANKTAMFLAIQFRKQDREAWYVFSFKRHALKAGEPSVAIFVDESPDSPISLRELIVKEKEIIRRRRDFENLGMTYDRDVSPVEVAKDFFEDVIRKVLA